MITKAIIPAAGFGTRFLPYTKAVPKEMLPIVDKPVIHYVVEEAVASGVREILIVTSRGKGAIEDYFDRHSELERHLEAKSDRESLEKLRNLSELAHVHTVRQKQIRGLGDAVAAARAFVGDEPFAVLLGDTMVEVASGPPGLRQLLDVFEKNRKSVVGLTEVPPSKAVHYGIAAGPETAPGVIDVQNLVEKPSHGTAPSNLAIAGRYVFTPEIFSCIAETHLDRSGEVQLTDAMDLLRRREGLLGVALRGHVHDVGHPAGFLRANLRYALQRDDLREEVAAWKDK